MFKGAGPGRPKGARNKKTIAREALTWLPRDKVLNSTATPMDVMALAMHHHLNKYQASLMRKSGPDEDALKRAMDAAQALAPYTHPRLATNNNISRTITSLSDLSDDELRALGVRMPPMIEGTSEDS